MGMIEVGQQFGSWTVLETDLRYNKRPGGLRVRCACGEEAVRDKRAVVDGRSKSCGKCGGRKGHAGGPRRVVVPGEQFGRWTVLGPADSNAHGQQMVRARCECGTEAVRLLASLRNGRSSSCGCYRREFMAERDVTHGLARKGNRHPLYVVWYGMMQRCYAEEDSRYADYGAKGITVWEPWHDPARFVRDVEREIGPRPEISSPHEWSLDRLRGSEGYKPGNIAWSTPGQQSRNRLNVIQRTLACECGGGIRVIGQVSWWRCLLCGQEHLVLTEDQRRRSR